MNGTGNDSYGSSLAHKQQEKEVKMDTTNKYIEMCKSAKNELQWNPTNGDVIHIPKGIKYEEYNDYGEGIQEEPKTIRYYDDGGRYYSFNHIYMDGLVVGTVFSENPHGRRYKLDDVIWLPRQDQLQGLLSKTCTLGYFISGLHEFFDPESLCPDGEYPPCKKCSEAGKERRTMYETMEQYWLAFIMSELFTKKWNGTEWIIEINVPGLKSEVWMNI